MHPKIPSTSDRIFCYFGWFFTLLPPNNPKDQNFEKMKKPPGDIITLHICNINDNHMMYGCWDMGHDRIFDILDLFCPFTPLATQKMKIWKKWKKTAGYYHFKHEYHKWHHMMYDSWDI